MLNQQQLQKLQQMGLTSSQINQVVQAAGGVEQQKSLAGFAGNVVNSGARMVGDIASSAMNPGKTIQGLGELVQNPQVLIDFYKQRYGKDLGKTLYEDPVGVLADLSTVLTLGGGAVSKIGQAGKLGGLAKAGQVAGEVGALVDPLNVGSKAKYLTKGINLSEPLRPLAKELAVKSTKATPSQLNKFEKLAGDVGEYSLNNKVFSPQDASKLAETLGEQRNAMVRTGKRMNTADVARVMKENALKMIEKAGDDNTKAVAEKMWAFADDLEKTPSVTDTFLADTQVNFNAKGNYDPLTANYNQKAGSSIGSFLESQAPGQRELSQKIKAAKMYENMVSSQANRGRASQVFNLFKPVSAGAITGAAAGSFLPVVGNAAGALIGGAGAVIANNPNVQRSAARALSGGVKFGVPSKVSKTANFLNEAGRAGRMINAPQSSQQSSQSPVLVPPATSNTTAIGSTAQQSSSSLPKTKAAFSKSLKVKRGKFY